MQYKSISLSFTVAFVVAVIIISVLISDVSTTRAQVGGCSAGAIAAGTCNWNGGGLVTPAPGTTPPRGGVFATLKNAVYGYNAYFSTNDNILNEPPSTGTHYSYCPPGYWCSTVVGLGPNASNISYVFSDYIAGDVFKYGNGTQVTVPSGGITLNCRTGFGNGCPSLLLPKGFPLSITKSGTGTGTVSGGNVINCGDKCSVIVGAGFPITLTATPTASSTFTGWSGGTCAGTLPTCTFTPTASVTVTAGFRATVVDNTPTNLTATLNLTSKTIDLSFSLPSGASASSLEVERAKSVDNKGTIGTYAKISSIGNVGSGMHTYSDSVSSLTDSFPLYYRVKSRLVDGTYSNYSNVAKVTSCAHISGTGPRRVVYIRGNGWNVSNNEYLLQVNNLIENGFRSIDPYKKYIGTFSFDVDISGINQSNFTKFVDTNDNLVKMETEKAVTLNSCGTDAYEYIILFSDNEVYPAWNSGRITNLNVQQLASRAVQMNVPDLLSFVEMHESGHTAGLADEYVMGVKYATSTLDDFEVNGYDLIGRSSFISNCSTNPNVDYTTKNSNGVLTWYGSSQIKGCSYALTPETYDTYYRPSDKSIMNLARFNTRKFNVVSCGYVVASILSGYGGTRAQAQTHWDECKLMDTVPIDYDPATIVTVSGIGTGQNNKIFDFMDSISPGSIRIPNGFKSFARNSILLRQAINSQLALNRKVVVVGHSVGSMVAYNVHSDYIGKNVKFIYLDPPYKFFACKMSSVFRAICQGIQSDSGTKNWTNGAAFGLFFSKLPTHDPFDFITAAGELQKADLRATIQGIINTNCTVDCSFTPTSVTSTLDTPPNIIGITPASGIPEQNVTINGIGFDPTGNNIQIESVSNPDIYYNIYDVVPNQNGSLTFNLPGSSELSLNIVPGQYMVKVSGENSDWSNALNMNISLPPAPIVDPVSVTPGATETMMITGSNFSQTNNTVILNRVSGNILNMLLDYQTQLANAFNSIQKWFTPSTSNAQVATTTYEILYATTTDKTHLSFTIPSNIPPGTYTMKVGAFGNVWSNAVTVNIKNASSGILPINGNPLPAGKYLTLTATALSQSQIKLAWSVTAGLSIPNFNLYDVTNLVGRFPAGTPLTITASMLSNITLPAPTLSNTTLNTYTFTGLSPNTVHCYVVQPASTYTATTRNSVCVNTRSVYQPGLPIM